jgi:hypothetical protein
VFINDLTGYIEVNIRKLANRCSVLRSGLSICLHDVARRNTNKAMWKPQHEAASSAQWLRRRAVAVVPVDYLA